MHFGFLNYRVGVVFCEDMTTKIAVLRKTCKGHVLVWSATFAEGERIHLPGKYYSCPVVLSLKGPGLLLRATVSTLKNKRQAKRIAENSLEHSLPFPSDSIFMETIVYQEGKQETLVSSWITTRERVISYFDRLKKISLQADDISCEPEALVHLTNSNEEGLSFLIVAIDGEISCTLLKGRHPLATRSFEKKSASANAKESLATLDHMLASFPGEELRSIKLWDIDNNGINETRRDLLQAIQEQTKHPVIEIIPPSCVEDLQPDSWRLYGSAIATAYHGFSSQKVHFRNAMSLSRTGCKFLLKKLSSPLAKLTLFSLIFVGLPATYRRMAVRNEIQENLFSIGEDFSLPQSSRLALTQIKAWREARLQKNKDYPYVPNTPGLHHVLAFLADFTKTSSGLTIKLSHISYALNSFPTEEAPYTPYSSSVCVKGSGTKEALQKLKILLHSPSLPFSISNIVWKESGENFEFSFTPEATRRSVS
ncbi:hypothetical protein [Chlamydiifrater volucris]|uniref:hypothetical protein n=1 Tax=Chlamydiifrater volucris TaxID=2681470 RepID=UPI001BCD1310|nr:hypothetical protein [Chlamydiifrater volucris]